MEELAVGDMTYCPTNSKTSYYFHDKQHRSPVQVHLKANGSMLQEHGKFWIRFYGKHHIDCHSPVHNTLSGD